MSVLTNIYNYIFYTVFFISLFKAKSYKYILFIHLYLYPKKKKIFRPLFVIVLLGGRLSLTDVLID